MTEDDRAPRRDPVYEFQRWLMRNGAKSVGRELKGTVSRTFGGGRQDPGDVWETATTEPPPGVGEAAECAWCPVCRAARRFRESGPGLASHVAGAGDALLSVAQDTLAAFEATLSARPPSGRKSPAGTGWPGEPGAHAEDATSVPTPPAPTGPPSVSRTEPPPRAGDGQPPVASTWVPPEEPAGPPFGAQAGRPPAADSEPAEVPGHGPAQPAGTPPAPEASAATAEPEAAGPDAAGPDAAGADPAGADAAGPSVARLTETGPAESGPAGAEAEPDGT